MEPIRSKMDRLNSSMTPKLIPASATVSSNSQRLTRSPGCSHLTALRSVAFILTGPSPFGVIHRSGREYIIRSRGKSTLRARGTLPLQLLSFLSLLSLLPFDTPP